MNICKTGTALAAAAALLLAAFLSPAVVAAPPETAAREIDHLLEHVGQSGCEFYRNGIWYKGNLGQAHLRDKYEYLVLRDMIGVAADFIDKAATRSSVTGIAYMVRCKGQGEMPSGQWLTEELARYRAAAH
jgi:hypothetical protein